MIKNIFLNHSALKCYFLFHIDILASYNKQPVGKQWSLEVSKQIVWSGICGCPRCTESGGLCCHPRGRFSLHSVTWEGQNLSFTSLWQHFLTARVSVCNSRWHMHTVSHTRSSASTHWALWYLNMHTHGRTRRRTEVRYQHSFTHV